jgi:hypothetical protein
MYPMSGVNDVLVQYTVTVVREGTAQSIQDLAVVEMHAIVSREFATTRIRL